MCVWGNISYEVIPRVFITPKKEEGSERGRSERYLKFNPCVCLCMTRVCVWGRCRGKGLTQCKCPVVAVLFYPHKIRRDMNKEVNMGREGGREEGRKEKKNDIIRNVLIF